MVLLIITLILISGGLVFWFLNINPFISFSIGAVLGIMLIVSLFRKLGKKAQNSLIALELFTKLSSYKPSYTVIEEKVKPENNHNDYKEMMTALKQMGFESTKAKEATNFAISRIPDEPLEEKIREALKYLGSKYKEVVR